MGATGWSYTTPYDSDADAALERLRDEVFVSGRYLRRGDIVRIRDHPGFFLSAPPALLFWLAMARTLGALIRLHYWLLRGGRGPWTIDELLEECGEDGTHSILDITHTADIPEFGAATPLTKMRLSRAFGTTTPTREQADHPSHDVGEGVRRWEAVYFAVYDAEGTPVELRFFGSSGD
jgi:hypothetical protein